MPKICCDKRAQLVKFMDQKKHLKYGQELKTYLLKHAFIKNLNISNIQKSKIESN